MDPRVFDIGTPLKEPGNPGIVRELEGRETDLVLESPALAMDIGTPNPRDTRNIGMRGSYMHSTSILGPYSSRMSSGQAPFHPRWLRVHTAPSITTAQTAHDEYHGEKEAWEGAWWLPFYIWNTESNLGRLGPEYGIPLTRCGLLSTHRLGYG
jgi:hypothetical protein